MIRRVLEDFGNWKDYQMFSLSCDFNVEVILKEANIRASACRDVTLIVRPSMCPQERAPWQ